MTSPDLAQNHKKPREVRAGEEVLAIHVPSSFRPEKTHFLTDPNLPMQLGFIRYPSGHTIDAHKHIPMKRQLDSTSECLFVLRGKVQATIYDRHGNKMESFVMNQGDILVLYAGGHGFKMIADALMVEIKQGPYQGIDEKEWL